MTDYMSKCRNQFISLAYPLMALSLVLNVSCATMSEKRYVENNTFISSYPKMAIKVSSEFEYLGEYYGDIFADAIGDYYQRAKIELVSHIFLQKGDEGDINKGLVIATYELSEEFHWRSDSVRKPGSYMDWGEIKFGGRVWPYVIWPTQDFFGSAKDFVQNHGFSTNQTFLVGAISKVIDHSSGGYPFGNTKMAIYYIEDQRICGSDSAQFMDRCLKAVQFLKEGKP